MTQSKSIKLVVHSMFNITYHQNQQEHNIVLAAPNLQEANKRMQEAFPTALITSISLGGPVCV